MSKDFFSKYKVPIILGVIVLIVIMFFVGMYNRFILMDQNVQAKWSEVENQYQRQSDLINNLVSTVSSAVSVETKFVSDVTDARTQWQAAGSIYDKDVAGVQMNNALTTFISAVMTAENYPVLQANNQYTILMDELTGTQNRISVARGKYIEAIQSYNTAIKMFPANVFAGMFGFIGKEYYQAETELITPTLGTGQLP